MAKKFRRARPATLSRRGAIDPSDPAVALCSDAMEDAVRLLFREVADLSPAQRDRYFEQHPVPPKVRADLESLLRYDLDRTFPAAEAIGSEAQAYLEHEAGEGRVCGPYRLVRLLGRGGAGAVYLAERVDGQIEQRVAIKLLRQDADDRRFRDRFLQERQILASLQHPGIARLLDAGQTGGQPYLVMDCVDGVTIDRYADNLELRSKLNLFLDVCDAVSYAHRNLVIHRDLKPSNILVDGAGRPRLLDFGIAKLLDAPADQTRTQERLLTPEYASPEQVRGAAQTTATDIYSLGAVLYHLLTGRSPHAFPTRTPEAIDDAICAKEPVAASRLNPELSRDLDFILGKALRKEREERYGSVDAMAGDIRAFLEWRPIRARSGNAWYRTRKFVRRYRALVAATLVTLLGLSAGLYVANAQRLIAQERFRQVHLLSTKIFDLDAKISRLPGATEARQNLVSAALEYLARLGASARDDLDLAQEIGEAYMRVARVQGVPGKSNLGDLAAAEESLRKADRFVDSVLESRKQSASALILSAGIAQDRMVVADTEKRPADVKLHVAKAVDRLDRLFRTAVTPAQRSDGVLCYFNVAIALMNQHMYSEGRQYVQKSMEAAIALPDEARYRAAGLSLIGHSLRSEGHLEEAIAALREARRVAASAPFASPQQRALDLYGILLREARTLGQEGAVSLGRGEEGAAVYQEAVDLEEQAAQRDPRDQNARDRLSTVSRELAQVLERRDPRRALAMFDLGILRLRELKNNIRARRREAQALADSSYPLRALRRDQEARERIDAALGLLRDTKDFPAQRISVDSEVVDVLRARADYESAAGDRRRAVDLYEELFAAMMASRPSPTDDLIEASRISMMYFSMAGAYRRAGDRGKAAEMDARRLELWRRWDGKLPQNQYVQRQIALRSE